MPPAIKGMEQAHDARLILGGAALHNGGGQHLDQPSADGIEDGGDQQAPKGCTHQSGQKGQTQKAQSGKEMGGGDAGAVADLIDKKGGRKVGDQLGGKIQRYQQRKLGQRDAEGPLKGQKEQRRKIANDRLGNRCGEAGKKGPIPILTHFI